MCDEFMLYQKDILICVGVISYHQIKRERRKTLVDYTSKQI